MKPTEYDLPAEYMSMAPLNYSFPCSSRPSCGDGASFPSSIAPELPAKREEGSQPLLGRFNVQQPVPICTLATHQNSHGHLHHPTTSRPVPKAKRFWMLFWPFLTGCPTARRFWGLERKTDSNTLMSSANCKTSPCHQTSPLGYSPSCFPVCPTGKGVSTSQLEAHQAQQPPARD